MIVQSSASRFAALRANRYAQTVVRRIGSLEFTEIVLNSRIIAVCIGNDLFLEQN